MSVKQQILDTLEGSKLFPLDQTSIAFRTGDIFASVRRTVQELTRANKIHIADYRGITGFPRFAFGPRPPVVSQAEVELANRALSSL